jgi:hypothetical protein
MDEEQIKAIHFPAAGLDVSQAFWRQPNRPIGSMPKLPNQHFATQIYARTSAVGVNVRGFEPASGRRRGGSRPGLVKYIATVPGGVTWITQELTQIVGTIPPPGAAQMQLSNSGRVVTVVAVSQGNVYYANAGDTAWTAAINMSGETPPLNFSGIMFSAANNQLLFFCDGINYVYFSPSNGTVFPWVVAAYEAGDTGGAAGTPKGKMPVDSQGNAARLIQTWRGRTVLSGLLFDPQNIFFSAVSDPFNWDYAPLSTTPTQAVALNLAPQGLIGDVVTSLCAYTDDILVVFGDHSIRMLRGDPMSGGQVDLISEAIGGSWGICWAKDPYGTIYFVSNKTGIYTLVPGQAPQRISQAIEQLLQPIDTGNNSIRVIWDDRWQLMHFFITPLAAPAATSHFAYEARTGAWWVDQFANNNHNPIALCAFDGNLPTDRLILLGSWDGYVRSVSLSATDDDGTPISSQVVIGPILTENMDDMLLKDVQAILGQSSGKVNYSIFVGPTAEAALSSAAVSTGVWSVSVNLAGRNFTNFIRRSGHAVYIQLTSNVAWAMEEIKIRIASQGKVRRRGK